MVCFLILEVDAAHAFALAGHLIDAGFAYDARLGHLDMGVATYDDIDVRDIFSQGKIVHHTLVDAQVGEADDELAALLLQGIHVLAGAGDGIEVAGSRRDAGGHQRLEVCQQAEHADLEAAAFEHHVGLDHLTQEFVRELVVGADNRELGLAEAFAEGVTAVVELVVAERDGVVAHCIHQFQFHIPFEEVEIGGALGEVAGIEQQHVGVLFAGFADEGLAAEESAHIGVGLIGKGFYLAVGVVGMEDDQLAFLGLERDGTGCHPEH